MESKIVRRVQQVMNILPSFSPYPSSSLPLTTTDTKGSARDNEQKKSKIMVAERSEPRKRSLDIMGTILFKPNQAFRKGLFFDN